MIGDFRFGSTGSSASSQSCFLVVVAIVEVRYDRNSCWRLRGRKSCGLAMPRHPRRTTAMDSCRSVL